MKKCSFKGIETYIGLITLDEKGRENHNIFINAGTQMSYTVTYRDTTSVLFKSKLCSNTHLSGTVIKSEPTDHHCFNCSCDLHNSYFS